MATATATRETKQSRPLPVPNSDFYELADVLKPARRGPELGEHNEEVLKQLGFSAAEIDGLRVSGAIPQAKERAA